MSKQDDDFQFQMAQALRKSHCERKNEAHECVGTTTISRGKVCLDCPLCGKGEHIPDWSYRLNILLGPVFEAAGIKWVSLGTDAKCAAFKAYRRATESPEYKAVSP